MKAKDFIIWFKFEGAEDYAIITTYSKEDAIDEFDLFYGMPITECHEIDNSIQKCFEEVA